MIRKIVIGFVVAWGSLSMASAQRLVIGQRPADVKIKEYVLGDVLPENRPVLIEFFYSPSKPSRDRLPVLNEMAKAYEGKVTVLVLARESRDRIEPLVTDKGYVFTVALDEEGKTFDGFEVEYVPFSVLMDAKGRVSWFGNSAQLTQSVIETELKL